MSDETAPDLRFIARQLRQVPEKVGSLREHVAVPIAITMRLGGSQAAMLAAIRGMHR